MVTENKAQFYGQFSLTLMFIKLIAGKLNEGNLLLHRQFFGNQVYLEYKGALSDECKTSLDNLKRYFSKSNLVNLVRNNYAFHYSPENIDAMLPLVPDDLEVYFQKGTSANTLYLFSEVLAIKALLKSTNAQDEVEAYERLFNDIDNVARWLLIVCQSLIEEFLKRYGDALWEGKPSTIVYDNPQKFTSVRIPWFTDVSLPQDETD